MIRYTLRSLSSLLFAAFVGSLVVFTLVNTLGGDVVTVMLGREAAPGDVEVRPQGVGVDRPVVVQYFDWLRGVGTGDLCSSYGMGYDIFVEIVRRMCPT